MEYKKDCLVGKRNYDHNIFWTWRSIASSSVICYFVRESCKFSFYNYICPIKAETNSAMLFTSPSDSFKSDKSCYTTILRLRSFDSKTTASRIFALHGKLYEINSILKINISTCVLFFSLQFCAVTCHNTVLQLIIKLRFRQYQSIIWWAVSIKLARNYKHRQNSMTWYCLKTTKYPELSYLP